MGTRLGTRNRNSEFFRKPTTLDRIKINGTVNPHPPLKSWTDEAARKPKRAVFPSLIWWEGGGGSINFPSILSKIL